MNMYVWKFFMTEVAIKTRISWFLTKFWTRNHLQTFCTQTSPYWLLAPGPNVKGKQDVWFTVLLHTFLSSHDKLLPDLLTRPFKPGLNCTVHWSPIVVISAAQFGSPIECLTAEYVVATNAPGLRLTEIISIVCSYMICQKLSFRYEFSSTCTFDDGFS